MANKEYRNMKVYEQSGYQYKGVPTIMMKGQWLRELGFAENTKIVVHCENGKLTITRAEADENSYDMSEAKTLCVAEPKVKFGGR